MTPFNSYEESELKEWNEIGRYRNYGVYSTNVMSRLVDVLRTESNRVSKITFQINLLGKDVGSYEVEYRCNKDPRKGGLVIREHTIPVPTTPSVKWMSSNFEDHYLTNAKKGCNIQILHDGSDSEKSLTQLQVISLEVCILKSPLPHLYQFRFQLA